MSDLSELAKMIKSIGEETEINISENQIMEELIRDLILTSASDGVSSANTNQRIDRIISVVTAREIK
jgi:hypothetical protein